jgi:hypothetical protein
MTAFQAAGSSDSSGTATARVIFLLNRRVPEKLTETTLTQRPRRDVWRRLAARRCLARLWRAKSQKLRFLITDSISGEAFDVGNPKSRPITPFRFGF